MSHTPGPWYAHDFSGLNSNGKKDPSDVCVSCTTPDHLTVCYMGNGLTGIHEEWKSNARLIAAAPDLLEALIYCRQKMDYMMTHGEWYSPGRALEMADAAIAKARGRV